MRICCVWGCLVQRNSVFFLRLNVIPRRNRAFSYLPSVRPASTVWELGQKRVRASHLWVGAFPVKADDGHTAHIGFSGLLSPMLARIAGVHDLLALFTGLFTGLVGRTASLLSVLVAHSAHGL